MAHQVEDVSAAELPELRVKFASPCMTEKKQP